MDDEWEGNLCNQSQPLEKPAVCNEELNNEEEDGGSQMDVSFCFSNSEIFCRKEVCFLNHVEEWSGISFKMHEKNEVVKSEILNEYVDVLVEDCHEHSCQGSFKKLFDNLQRELLLEQLSHGKPMT